MKGGVSGHTRSRRFPTELIPHSSRSLVLLGLMWTIYGVRVLFDPTEFYEHYVFGFLPHELRAMLWATCGSFAVTCALSSRKWSKVGFTLLVIPAGLRAFSLAWAGVLHLLGGEGDPTGLVQSLSWFLVVALVIHESSSVDPPSSMLFRDEGDR